MTDRPGTLTIAFLYYSLIAFDKRVTFWLQRVRSLPCACAYLSVRLVYNYYAIALAYNVATAHARGSDQALLTKKLLSCRRQSDFSAYSVAVASFYMLTNAKWAFIRGTDAY